MSEKDLTPTADLPAKLHVDDERLTVTGALSDDRTYDVLLNDRHVWSVQPGRDARHVLGRVQAAWPKALRPYLSGRARVVLRDHEADEVVAVTEHVFAGDEAGEVTVVNKHGQSLILDKWGRLIRPLAGEDDEAIDALMDEVIRLLDTLRDKAGVPAFISYGTLLGAVRDGRLIGHDNDIDLAYVSEHPHPVDVVREAYRVERVLLDEGWVVRRGSGVRINVRLSMPDESLRFVDVFTAHWVEGVLYIPSDTGFELPRETILPLTEVELHGRPVPAPADSERLLRETYGENWRVPDPSFKYETPRWMARRFGGWFGGLMTQRKHWDSFYSKRHKEVPRRPSPFATWVHASYPTSRPLVDVGSGNGRDSVWFGKQGRRAVGLDYSFHAVNRARRLARRRSADATFRAMNLYDAREVLAYGMRLSRSEEPVDLYARFTMHALEEVGRQNLVRLASMSLRRGGLLFLEFRTPADAKRRHLFGEHRRHYLAPDMVTEQIEAAGGRVLAMEQGTGLAPLEREDPVVCRIVASWEDEA